MGNIRDNGWDLGSLKYIEMLPVEVARYRVRAGDVLVNRTNTEQLVGKAAAWPNDDEFVFASYLIRLQAREGALDPWFLAAWLNSSDARRQIDRISRRSAGQTNINSSDLRDLMVPALSPAAQQALAEELRVAMNQREERVGEIRASLAALNSDVASLVGLPEGQSFDRLWVQVDRGLIAASRRLDFNYYHPSRAAAAAAVAATEHVPLGDCCDLVRGGLVDTKTGYGLGCVESGTGRLNRKYELEPISGGLPFEADDVLISRLRPALNKVWVADRPGICSPEFRVLRPNPGLNPRYLAGVLRCWFALDQLKWTATGNTHPRAGDEDLRNLLVPRRPEPVELEVAAFIDQRLRTAELMELDAESEWALAKSRFVAGLMVT